MAFQSQKPKEMCRAFCLGALLCLFGCSTNSSSPLNPEKDEILLVNYTRFHNRVWVSELEGKYFHTALMRVTFELLPDGSTKLAQEQEELGSHVSVNYGCDPGVVAVSSDVAFRKKAEVYLQNGDLEFERNAEVVIGKEKHPIFTTGACPRFSAPSDPFLVSYPVAGTWLEVRGVKPPGARSVRWNIPEVFSPYVLVRYQSGEMIPTPMRADTIFLRPAEKKLSVIYRATFPFQPKVRKAEFRLIQKDDKRSLEEVDYLNSCPIPSLPPEPCSLPDRRPSAAFFGN